MKRVAKGTGKVLLIILALPLAATAALFAGILGRKEKRTAAEVATYLRRFIEGGGGNWDWDDFTSVPIADPQLENIRRRALAVEVPPTNEGVRTLSELLAEAEQLLPS